MKRLLPVFAILLVLPGCKPSANQDQERMAEEQEARQQSELRERKAALDERERLVAEKEKRMEELAKQRHLDLGLASSANYTETAPGAAAAPAQGPAGGAEQGGAGGTGAASFEDFFNMLSPYGTWVELPAYGYVWQPAATVQDEAWKPYTLGHWAFTDAGWTWVSDEPFGWAVYHYGRWMRTHTLGWVWVPGNLWAPGWVSWRYSANYVGWAPLPPEARFEGATGIHEWADQVYQLSPEDYTFVPAAEFGDPSMAAEAVGPEDEDTAYDDTANVTDMYYDAGIYGVACYGPDFDYLRKHSRRRLHDRYHLDRSGFHEHGDNRAVISGGTLRVAAPQIHEARGSAGPPSQNYGGRVPDSRFIGAARGGGTNPGNVPGRGGPKAPGGPGLRIPGGMRPGPLGEASPAGEEPATGMRYPSQLNPVPLSQAVQEQKARDLQQVQEATGGAGAQQVEPSPIAEGDGADAATVRAQAAQPQEQAQVQENRARIKSEEKAREEAAAQEAPGEKALEAAEARQEAARQQMLQQQQRSQFVQPTGSPLGR